MWCTQIINLLKYPQNKTLGPTFALQQCWGSLGRDWNELFHSPANLAAQFLSYWSFITSTSQKNKNQQNKPTAWGCLHWCDKATVTHNFVSVLRVCDIDKNYISIFSGILLIKIIWWYFADKDCLPWTADSTVFDILRILCGQFAAVIEVNIFQ